MGVDNIHSIFLFHSTFGFSVSSSLVLSLITTAGVTNCPPPSQQCDSATVQLTSKTLKRQESHKDGGRHYE